MRGCFITATGTDVGKTLVTAGLLRSILARGRRTIAAKPFQTGCMKSVDGTLVPEDVVAYERASGIDYAALPAEAICRYRFEPACSPHLAAEQIDVECSAQEAIRSIRLLESSYDTILVEGAGGMLVPLGSEETMLDLAVGLGLPVVVVVDNRLGCINHTLMTIETIRRASLDLVGIIMNETSPPADEVDRMIREDNPRAIARHGDCSILARIEYMPDFSPEDDQCWQRIADRLVPVAERIDDLAP